MNQSSTCLRRLYARVAPTKSVTLVPQFWSLTMRHLPPMGSIFSWMPLRPQRPSRNLYPFLVVIHGNGDRMPLECFRALMTASRALAYSSSLTNGFTRLGLPEGHRQGVAILRSWTPREGRVNEPPAPHSRDDLSWLTLCAAPRSARARCAGPVPS